MAIKPVPTPSADPYITYSTDKSKKKKQTNSGYVTNTVTPPPKPAAEMPSTPSATLNYTQSVPKPNTSSQTNGYLTNAGSYNPLSLKQNSQSSQKSAMDTIYNRTVTYDTVPTPKTPQVSYKAPTQKSYSYTEPKPKANQYVSNSMNTNNTAKMYSYNSPKPTRTPDPKHIPILHQKQISVNTKTNVIKLREKQKRQLNIIKQNVILSEAKNLLVRSNREILRHKCLRMTYLLLT